MFKLNGQKFKVTFLDMKRLQIGLCLIPFIVTMHWLYHYVTNVTLTTWQPKTLRILADNFWRWCQIQALKILQNSVESRCLANKVWNHNPLVPFSVCTFAFIACIPKGQISPLLWKWVKMRSMWVYQKFVGPFHSTFYDIWWPNIIPSGPNGAQKPAFPYFLVTMATYSDCGSPPGVIVADTLSFNAKMDLVDFWV